MDATYTFHVGPVVFSGSLRSVEQLGKLDLLMEKLRELSIRTKQHCVSKYAEAKL